MQAATPAGSRPAWARALQLSAEVSPRRLGPDDELGRLVQAKLKQEWSPQQIAAWLRLTYPDRPSWQICPETIFQAQ